MGRLPSWAGWLLALTFATGGVGATPVQTTDTLTTALARINDRLANDPNDLEASLLRGILHFKTGRLAEASAEIESLTRRAPKFHLAHLIQGDLLALRARTVTDIGQAPVFGGQSQSLSGLREEAEVRLSAYLESLPRDRLPRSLLSLGDSVRTAVVVDKLGHRLYVYERDADGTPRLLRDYYVSTGKLMGNKRQRGDLRTPEGVYFIVGHIPQSRLPDKYGVSAFPTNYPNELDLKLGKTGDGIWLHGTEGAYYSRPPLDSEGCVVLPNPDLLAVSGHIKPGATPMIIAERVEWLERSEWQAQRAELLGAVEAWRTDWESGDVERYLAHYAEGFWAKGFDARSWGERKRQVAQGKTFQRVTLADVAVYAYPTDYEGRKLAVVDFRQEYQSNNFNSSSDKRLYLAREGERWKVLYEGPR